MALWGRFSCYSCGYEHAISERKYDELEGERFARSMNCPKNPGKMQEIIDDREFYRILHATPNPRYASA
jgi:hypothetical protein